MRSIIKYFTKGLVDEVVKGQVNQEYNHKVLELENAYIGTNNSAKKRPGLQKIFNHETPGILDTIKTDKRRYVLRNAAPNPQETGAEDRTSFSNSYLRTIEGAGAFHNSLSIFNKRIDVGVISGTSDKLIAEFEWSHAGVLETEPEDVRTLDSYDNEGDRKEDECYTVRRFRIRERVTLQSLTIHRTRTGTSDAFIASFDFLDDQTKYEIPGGEITHNMMVSYLDNLQTARSAVEVANNEKDLEAILGLIKNDFVKVFNKDLIKNIENINGLNPLSYIENKKFLNVYREPYVIGGFSDVVLFLTNCIKETGTPEEGITLSLYGLSDLVGFATAKGKANGTINNLPFFNSSQFSLFDNFDLPNKFIKNGEDVYINMAGSNYNVDGFKNRNTGLTGSSVDFLSEKEINTFTTKNLDININDLDIQTNYMDFLNRDLTFISIPGFGAPPPKISSEVSSMQEFLENNPNLLKIRDYLKFSLTNVGLESGSNNIYNIIPDIKLTIPGSDVNSSAKFLFTTQDGINVFAYNSENIYNKTGFTSSPDKNRFKDGVGASLGGLGVTVLLQRYNKIDDNSGDPIFFPYPIVSGDPVGVRTSGKDLTQEEFLNKIREVEGAETIGVALFKLNPVAEGTRGIMSNIDLFSMYSSNGKTMRNNILKKIEDQNYFILRSDDGNFQYFTNEDFVRNPLVPQLSINVQTSERTGVPYGFVTYQLRKTSKEDVINMGLCYKFRSNESIEIKDQDYLKSINFANDAISSEITTKWAKAASQIAQKFVTGVFNHLEGSGAQANVTYPLPDLPATLFVGADPTISTSNVSSAESLAAAIRAERTLFELAINVNADVPVNRGTTTFGRGNREDTYDGKNYLQLSAEGRAFWISKDSSGRVTRYNVYKYLGRSDASGKRHYDSVIENGVTYYRSSVRQVIANLKNIINLENSGISIGSDIYIYSTEFKAYEPDTELSFSGEDRDLKLEGSRVHFSSERNRNLYSLGFRDFIRGNIFAYPSTEYLRPAGLEDYVKNDLSLEVISDDSGAALGFQPQTVELIDSEVVGYTDTDRGGALASTNGIYFVAFTQSGIVVRRQVEEGVETPIINNSSAILGGSGSNLKINRFYEDAGGYTSDTANYELEFPRKIKSIVSLVNNHQIVLVELEGGKELYTLAFSKNRQLKGFSRFSFKHDIKSIRKEDEDKLSIIFDNNSYILDFSDTTHMTDGYQEGTEIYDYSFRTLPLLNPHTEDYSVTRPTSVESIIVSAKGDIKFRYEIIDNETGRIEGREYKAPDKKNAVTSETKTGLFWINNIPTNSSQLPEIRVVKRDDKYIEISSLNIQLGDS